MNIVAAIIDHNQAGIDERELFAFGDKQAELLYETTKKHPDILGSVLLHTCNRTELYLSLKCMNDEAEDDPLRCAGEEKEALIFKQTDPFRLLCESLKLDPSKCEHLVRRVKQDHVLLHLCLLASGALSQLVGDSQIITQVVDALADAQERNATDGVLNTVFRLGVTAGKKVRTNKSLKLQDESTVDRAVQIIQEQKDVRSVLVIGNGVIGRLAAKKLAARGYETAMTLRQYHNREAIIPGGVSVVPYEERYAAMEQCDAVVSATASPHIVITKEAFLQVKNPPRLLIDLAVPRDIEASVSEKEGVVCLNIDEISGGREQSQYLEKLEALKEYVGEYVEELHRWEKERIRIDGDVRRLSDPERDRTERRYFPLFIDSYDHQAVVIGGGNIAERRVLTLAEFGFRIRVVSNSLTDTLKRMVDGGAAVWVRSYVTFDETSAEQSGTCLMEDVTEDAWLVLSCTNDRDTNRRVGEYCKEKQILVNISDARKESTFWFPAVGLNDELTMGLIGTGTDHKNVKKAAAALRSVIRDKEYK